MAVSYFAAAKLGLSLAFEHSSVSAVWPASGIALAAVLLCGYELLWAVALGALAAELSTPAPLGAVLGITLGATLAACAGAWLLDRARFDRSLTRMRDVIAIVVLAGGVSTAISAAITSGSLAAFGALDGVRLATAFRTGWLGDAGGDLLVASALLVFVRTPRRWLLSRDAALVASLTLLLGLLTALVLRYDSALPYLIFAPLLLVALVGGERGAVLSGLVVGAIAVWLTARGHGTFTGHGRDTDLIRAQTFVCAGAITALLVAAARSEREVAERALSLLADKERVLADAQRLARVGSFEHDVLTRKTTWSDELYRIVGLDPAVHPAGYASLRPLLHPDDLPAVDGKFRAAMRDLAPFESVHRIVRPDGLVRTIECHSRVERALSGAPVRVVGTAVDITAVALAEERFRSLFETAPYACVVIDPAGTIVLVNGHTEHLFGWERAELIGTPLGRLIAVEGAPWHATAAGDAHGVELELRARRRDGAEFLVEVSLTQLRAEGGNLVSVSISDITGRKLAAEALAHRASHDSLTGLPNRTLFLDRLEHALRRARRSGRKLAVMFLDLDDFKLVNDTRGHDVGDLLLVGLTPKLSSALRPGDTIARFGGDEFVVLCEDLADPADALAIAERIAHACGDGVRIGDYDHIVTVSTGVVLVSEPELVSPSEVLRDADAAMYRAKSSGKGQIELFDDGMRARLVERLAIEASLRRAIRRDELRVVYQPIMGLMEGRIVAAEALVRWEHPHRGLLEPAEFLDVAESCGLIVQIGEFVLEQACRQAVSWRDRPGIEPVRVSVNMSARQLARPDLARSVARILREAGLEPGFLEIEVTEAVLFDDLDAAARALLALKAIGVRVVLDDFGTGYSSLGYLRRLPIDALKIEGALVRELERDPEARAIASAVLSMADALDIGVTAEGVETEAQLARVRELGCEFGQGYLLARPAPADELGGLLEGATRESVPA